MCMIKPIPGTRAKRPIHVLLQTAQNQPKMINMGGFKMQSFGPSTNYSSDRAMIRPQLQASALRGYARGTNYSMGGISLVGERGPELLNLRPGSQVIPNNKIGSTLERINTNRTAGTQASQQASTQTIILKVDGKTLSTVINNYNQDTMGSRPDSKVIRRK